LFKNIGAIFERRKKILSIHQDKKSLVKQGLQGFLMERFGDNLKGLSFNIDYNSKDNSLTITADNKIVANELSLQLHDLIDYLSKQQLNLSRILIR
jgi:hypothetical protein